MPSSRAYTTREVAAFLGVPYCQALPVLKAACVPARRCGAAYLWDGSAVEGLKAALQERGLAQADAGDKSGDRRDG